MTTTLTLLATVAIPNDGRPSSLSPCRATDFSVQTPKGAALVRITTMTDGTLDGEVLTGMKLLGGAKKAQVIIAECREAVTAQEVAAAVEAHATTDAELDREEDAEDAEVLALMADDTRTSNTAAGFAAQDGVADEPVADNMKLARQAAIAVGNYLASDDDQSNEALAESVPDRIEASVPGVTEAMVAAWTALSSEQRREVIHALYPTEAKPEPKAAPRAKLDAAASKAALAKVELAAGLAVPAYLASLVKHCRATVSESGLLSDAEVVAAIGRAWTEKAAEANVRKAAAAVASQTAEA